MEICVRRMLERKVDGVAIMTSEMDPELIQMLSGRGIPIVFLDTGAVGPGISNISLDYDSGVDQAMGPPDLARAPQDRICQRSGKPRLGENSLRSIFSIVEAQETKMQ